MRVLKLREVKKLTQEVPTNLKKKKKKKVLQVDPSPEHGPKVNRLRKLDPKGYR